MNTIFDGYEEWCGDIQTRSTGSLISFDTGDAVTYGLFNAQQRGTLIVNAGEKVYAGEVVGYTPTGEDITVNVCKTKHLTNTRASGSDAPCVWCLSPSSASRAALSSWHPTSCWKSPPRTCASASASWTTTCA